MTANNFCKFEIEKFQKISVSKSDGKAFLRILQSSAPAFVTN